MTRRRRLPRDPCPAKLRQIRAHPPPRRRRPFCRPRLIKMVPHRGYSRRFLREQIGLLRAHLHVKYDSSVELGHSPRSKMRKLKSCRCFRGGVLRADLRFRHRVDEFIIFKILGISRRKYFTRDDMRSLLFGLRGSCGRTAQVNTTIAPSFYGKAEDNSQRRPFVV